MNETQSFIADQQCDLNIGLMEISSEKLEKPASLSTSEVQSRPILEPTEELSLSSTNLSSPLNSCNSVPCISYGKTCVEVEIETENKQPVEADTPESVCLNPSLIFNSLKVLTGSWSEFSIKHGKEVFLNGCKWSPDGTCLLTNSNDFTMRLFDLPLELYNCHSLSNFEFPEVKPSVKTKIGGLVYDFGWYPLMTSANPHTCCFVTTSFRAPVQLWDAYSGCLLCSYRGFNLQDELVNALSVTFHPSGDFLLCGYKDNIKIFHTEKPGRDFTNLSTKALNEQQGIVSCITVNHHMPNIFAAGTYSKSIGLYSMDGHALCQMKGQSGGLTQLIFSQDGSQLISAGRKDPEILCWDLRQPGQVLWTAKRPHTTNQRLHMDLSVNNHYLLSGSSDGHVYVWDLQTASTTCSGSETILEPFTKWKAHNDCVNGLSVHRQIPVIATASGQRYIPELIDNNDDELLVVERNQDNHEDSVKFWWAGEVAVST